MTRRRLLRTMPLVAGALWGCEDKRGGPRYRLPSKPLSIVTTTVHAADLVRAIGGDAVTVTSLIPALANPHLWQPVAADHAAVQLADAFFLSGLGLESRFTADLDQLRSQGIPVGVLANGLADDDILRRPDGKPDPHFWMDPSLWAKAAKEVADVLSEAYPQAALWFADQSHAYAGELGRLHDIALKAYSEIPANRRFLFTSHDSMAYFGAAYRLQVRSMANAAGEAPATIPGELTTWLTENGIKNLFREHFADMKTVRSLARPLNLNPDFQIFSLSVGKPGTILAGISGEMDVSLFLPALRYTMDTIQGRLAAG
jgi:manganese/zinc/iron transport system substrate-binding protein